MDISIVGKNSIKIKGKEVTFLLDPSREMPKTPADAVILSSDLDSIDLSRVEDSRIVIDGPGEFEVKRAKVSGVRCPKGILYKFLIDNLNIVAGRVEGYKADASLGCQIVVINADNEFDESSFTAFEPKITVLYGEKKEEIAKKLGAESTNSASKITVINDKLPEKMEIVILASSLKIN